MSLLSLVLPVMTREPETLITVDEDKPFQLFCAFKGSPGPLTSVTWMRSPLRSTHYTKVALTPRHKITSNREGSSWQLLVNNSIADEDSAQYRCQVTTTGFDPVYSESATVMIRERLKWTGRHIIVTASTLNCSSLYLVQFYEEPYVFMK